jgi:hypothetical protein
MDTVYESIDRSNFTKFKFPPKGPDPLWGPLILLLSSFPAIKEAETGTPLLTEVNSGWKCTSTPHIRTPSQRGQGQLYL